MYEVIIQVMIKHPHKLMLALLLSGYVICCSFMFVNKRTVLNENCVPVRSCSMDRKEREPNSIRLAN